MSDDQRRTDVLERMLEERPEIWGVDLCAFRGDEIVRKNSFWKIAAR